MLQKIIREHPDFISVAQESGSIWQNYVHPSLNDWQCEMFDTSDLSQEKIEEIKMMFGKYALSANLWNKFGKLNIMKYQQNPFLAPVLRTGYKVVTMMLNTLPKRGNNSRLVDKSVHCGLWLNLIDSVFPDALYIHIMRNGIKSVDSMIDGWLNPNRFFTYTLPKKLEIPDYPYQMWNFALPQGWSEYTKKPLEEVVSFQWCQIQQSIMTYFKDENFKGRTISIKLEDLVSDTGQTLGNITSFIGLEWDSYFKRLAKGLPVINSQPSRKVLTGWHKNNPGYKDKILLLTTPTMKTMGYT
jgi:hypothetical protein